MLNLLTVTQYDCLFRTRQFGRFFNRASRGTANQLIDETAARSTRAGVRSSQIKKIIRHRRCTGKRVALSRPEEKKYIYLFKKYTCVYMSRKHRDRRGNNSPYFILREDISVRWTSRYENSEIIKLLSKINNQRDSRRTERFDDRGAKSPALSR